MRNDRGDREPGGGSLGADDRRDPTEPPPPVREGGPSMRRRTPTIPYAPLAPRPEDSSPGGNKKPAALRGLRAKPVVAEPVGQPRPPDPAKARLNAGLGQKPGPPQSERYEHLTTTVEFTSQKDILDTPYDLEESLAPHLAWLTDDSEREDLFKQLAKGDHGRTLSIMVEARRRYPRNISIGRAIQIVERAAIARLLARIGPLEHVPERVGQPTLGRDPVSIFGLVDGRSTFEDILRGSPFPRLRTLEILAELVRRNAVRVRDDLLPNTVPQAVRTALTSQEVGARQHASMRPRLETAVPFAEEDATGRATIPDPLEVAARAALLRDPGDLPARSPSMRARAITPQASRVDREQRQRHTGAGFRSPARPLDPPKAAIEERPAVAKGGTVDDRAEPDAEPDETAPPPTRPLSPRRDPYPDDPPVTARRSGSVTAAELLAEVEREVRAVEASKRASMAKSARSLADAVEGAQPKGTMRSPNAVTRKDFPAPQFPTPTPPASSSVHEASTAPPPREVEIEIASAPRLVELQMPESVPARSTLESAIPRVASSAPPPVALSSSADTSLGESPIEPRLDLHTDSSADRFAEVPPSRRRPAAVLWLAAAAVLLSGVAVIIALTRGTGTGTSVGQGSALPIPAPTPTQTAVATPAPTSAPSSQVSGALGTIHLTIDATPREARVYLDDTLLTGHPVQQTLQKDNKQHQLRVEAAGYRTRTTTVDGSADTKLIIALELMPPMKPPPTAVPVTSGRNEDIYH